MINRLKTKKADLNQVFVYLVGVIIVGFVGLLVVKFVGYFTSDVQDKNQIQFFDDLKTLYSLVYREWGSEKIHTFKLSQEIEYVCFIKEVESCSNSNFNDFNFTQELITIGTSGDDLAVFDETGILHSTYLGDFKISDSCICEKPDNNNIGLYLQNKRNEVLIDFS